MPSYAFLGATGSVGQSLGSEIFPSAASSTQVKFFEGSLQDTSLLASSLRGTDSAFLAVAEVVNNPGCSIAQERAHAVVSASTQLKKQNKDAKLPRLIVLSSASLDHSLMSSTPAFILSIIYRANSYIYDDLRAAQTYLLSLENRTLVAARFGRLGALAHEAQKDHYLTTEKAEMPLSFLDLAAGMLGIAEDEEVK